MTDIATPVTQVPLGVLLGDAFANDQEIFALPHFVGLYLPLLTRLSNHAQRPVEDDDRLLWRLAESRDLKPTWVRLGLSLLEGKDVGDVESAVRVYQQAALDGGFETLRVLLKLKMDEQLEDEIAERCVAADVEWDGIAADPESAQAALKTIPKKRDFLVVQKWLKGLSQARTRDLKDTKSELEETRRALEETRNLLEVTSVDLEEWQESHLRVEETYRRLQAEHADLQAEYAELCDQTSLAATPMQADRISETDQDDYEAMNEAGYGQQVHGVDEADADPHLTADRVKQVFESAGLVNRGGQRRGDESEPQALSQSSLDVYISNMRGLIFGSKYVRGVGMQVRDGDFTVNHIMTTGRGAGGKWNANTAKTYLIAYSRWIEALEKENNQEQRSQLQVIDVKGTLELIRMQQDYCSELLDVQASKQTYTEAEMENYLEWDVLKARVQSWLERQVITPADVESLPFSEIRRLMTIAALRVVVLDHEPRRLDVFAVRCEQEEGKNHYDSSTRTLILDEFKTVKSFGRHRLQVSEQTAAILEILLAYGKHHRRQYIFSPIDEPATFSYTAHAAWASRFLSTAMSKATEKAINCDLLRKLYIEHAQKTGLLDDPMQRRAVSTRMAHDVRTQVKHYAKDVGRSRKRCQSDGDGDADADEPGQPDKQRKRTVLTDEQRAALREVKAEQEAMQNTKGWTLRDAFEGKASLSGHGYEKVRQWFRHI